MSPLFRVTGEKDHNRACDTVLIREHNGTLCDIVRDGDTKSLAEISWEGF